MIDRFELFSRMVSQTPIALFDGRRFLISSIQMEDGSGWKFILTGHIVGTNQSAKYFVNTKTERWIEMI